MIRIMTNKTSDNFSAKSVSQAFKTDTPILSMLTRERFADLVGLTHKTVYAMCDRGYLPTIHFGRRVFLNVEAIRGQCIDEAQKQG